MKKISVENEKWLIENYPNKWKKFCAKFLWKTESRIRDFASEKWLRINKDSEFVKERQSRARQSKIWKKRPLHSEFMKKHIRETNNILFIWKKSEEHKKKISENNKKRIQENWHPRWMLWKTHSEINRKIMSESSKKMWLNPESKVNSIEYRQEISNRVSFAHSKWAFIWWYSRAKKSKYNHNWKIYSLRSDWERIYCKYLDILIKWQKILDWEYEPETFRFLKIMRWVRSYKPDYKIYNLDWSIEYHEVKWRMDGKSKTKISRMKKYYPKIKLKIIREDFIKKLKNFIQ